MQGMSVSFGGVRAVDDVSMRVSDGQLVGLIGPNGAGKTTAVDAMTGFVQSRGKVRLDGREISRLPVHRRVRAGLTRTWQSSELFDDLTVLENLRVAAECTSPIELVLKKPWQFRGKSTTSEGLDQAVDLLGLDDKLNKLPTELSHGQRKLVGVARALASQPAASSCWTNRPLALTRRRAPSWGPS